MRIDATGQDYTALNERLRGCGGAKVQLYNCCGQRYIGCGLTGGELEIWGVPGNALGAYMDGGSIRVHGNTQDAVGDTMNGGSIYVEGLAGDAAGYAMRGGQLLVQGSVGYRAGVHMKEYEGKCPCLVVGGTAGSFLGEYQAGGLIAVLGLGCGQGQSIVGSFCGKGMHGGRIYLRTPQPPSDLGDKLICRRATPEDMRLIQPLLAQYCSGFGAQPQPLLDGPFYCILPDSRAPYRQLYAPV